MNIIESLSQECPLLADAIIWLQNNPSFYYYGYFCTYFKFVKDLDMESPAGVTVKKDSLLFYYNTEEFGYEKKIPDIDSAKFLVIHECNHILLNHIHRCGERNKTISNIAMDMLINSDIKRNHKHLALDWVYYLPKEYNGELLYELVYEWLIDQTDNNKMRIPMNGGIDDHDKMEDASEADAKLGEQIIREIHSKLTERGFVGSNVIEKNMDWEPKKNKVNVFKKIFNSGASRESTYRRENRRHPDLKGRVKRNKRINVILDTSGSLYDQLDKYVSNIIGDYETRVIQCDTDICFDKKIRTIQEWKNIPKHGGGGTILMPAVSKLIEERDFCPLYIITDGFTDELDFTRYKDSVCIITTQDVPPHIGNAKIIYDVD